MTPERKIVKIRPSASMHSDIALVENGTKLITRYTDAFTKGEATKTELWDLKTGKRLWQSIGSSPRGGHLDRLITHHDGKRVWAQVPIGSGTAGKPWNLADGRRLGFMHSRTEYGALTPDGRTLFGPDFNGTFLEVLETCSGKKRQYLGIGEPHGFMRDGVQAVSLPGGRLIAARDNDSRSDVIFWD